MILVALSAKEVSHDALNQTSRELTIKGTAVYRNIFPEVIALINSDRLPVEKLITSVISLDEIVEKRLETLVKDPFEVKKLVGINR